MTAGPTDVANRTWFITGVSSGLGRHMTEQLLQAGARVAGTARTLDTLAELSGRYGDRFWTASLDLTAAGDVRSVVERAFSELGRIDVVISNAGYGAFGAAEEFTDEQVDHHIATNLVGPIAVARAVAPYLRAQGGGRLIQLSTYGGQAANAGASLYNAGKFGVEGFMEALAAEVEAFGIGVTIVEPGGTRTNFRANAVLAEPLAAYDGTPAASVRSLRSGLLPSPVSPERAARLIIESAATQPAPLRLVLGSDAYGHVRAALEARLAGVVAQETTAGFADEEHDAGL